MFVVQVHNFGGKLRSLLEPVLFKLLNFDLILTRTSFFSVSVWAKSNLPAIGQRGHHQLTEHTAADSDKHSNSSVNKKLSRYTVHWGLPNHYTWTGAFPGHQTLSMNGLSLWLLTCPPTSSLKSQILIGHWQKWSPIPDGQVTCRVPTRTIFETLHMHSCKELLLAQIHNLSPWCQLWFKMAVLQLLRTAAFSHFPTCLHHS